MSTADSVTVRVLDGVRIEDSRSTLTPRQQLLLGVLAVRGKTVSTDALVELLWPDGTPARPRSALQVHVSRLRRLLEQVGATIGRQAGGYALEIEPSRLDVTRFERLVTEGTALVSDDAASGIEMLYEALGLWRAPPPDFLAESGLLHGELSRLDELHSSALETRIETEITLGRSRQTISELRRMVADNPVREEVTRLLMLALASVGRISEALDSYELLRHGLAEELGIDPGKEVQALRSSLLGRTQGRPVTEPATANDQQLRVVNARRALEQPAADEVSRGLDYLALADALQQSGDPGGESAGATDRALELIPDIPTEARARALVASAWHWRASPEVAAVSADHAIECTELTGSAHLLSDALVYAGAAEAMLGGLEVGRELVLRGRFVAEQLGHLEGVLNSFAVLAEVALLAGEPGESVEVAQAGRSRLPDDEDHALHRGVLVSLLLAGLARSGRWGEALRLLSTLDSAQLATAPLGAEAVRLRALTGDFEGAQQVLDSILATEATPDARIGLAEAWLAFCREDWARLHTAATRALRSTGQCPASTINELVFLAVAGQRGRRQGKGEVTAARHEVARLLTMLRDNPGGMPTADLWAALARAEAADTATTAADRWRDALQQASALEGWPEAALYVRSRLALAVGPEESSAELLAAALAEAEQLGSPPLGRRAREVAARIGFDPKQPDAFAAWNLTPREREVLDQLADGASNRAIAARLGISEKTASVHVSNLLHKVGASSRTELALLASQNR